MTVLVNICGLHYLKNNQTITQEILKLLTTSKRMPLKKESDRGNECYNSISESFSEVELFSIFQDIQIKVLQELKWLLKR